ncbi:nitroreductase family protein [Pseudodesulfovibrio tunisiensis]|uniref:nitroreductase family protein n=1 Tax=Pseudodesulfovibrio tunisiensis TaxID=463192 RepID=UPI001FB4FE18|nr:nitroreductase family protein [Pseudodesulfovibrio tunisiensis]
MTLFTVDPDLCRHEGDCARECPLGCIVMGANGLPIPHERKYRYCMGCGHCMAVCKTGAIQLEAFARGGEPLNWDQEPGSEQVVQFLKSRRSVRVFKDKPVDKDVIADLLDLTQYAPSGHNARPVQWSIAGSAERVAVVAEAVVEWMRSEVEEDTPLSKLLHFSGIVRKWDEGTDLVCRNAPVLAVAHAPKQGITPVEDCVIAVTYLDLAAKSRKLGCCWCGFAAIAARYNEAVRASLGVPEDNRVSGALLLGYPARRYSAIPPRPPADATWLF